MIFGSTDSLIPPEAIFLVEIDQTISCGAILTWEEQLVDPAGGPA